MLKFGGMVVQLSLRTAHENDKSALVKRKALVIEECKAALSFRRLGSNNFESSAARDRSGLFRQFPRMRLLICSLVQILRLCLQLPRNEKGRADGTMLGLDSHIHRVYPLAN